MYRDRKAYLEYRHRKWAAGVIALTWVMNVKMATMKRQLKVTRQREIEHFKERAKVTFWHLSLICCKFILFIYIGYCKNIVICTLAMTCVGRQWPYPGTE